MSSTHSPIDRDGIASYLTDPKELNRYYPSEKYARLAEAEESNFWFRSRNRVLVSLLEQFLPRPAKILDVGCGTGYVLRGMAGLPGLQLVGADYYLEGLRFAKQRVPSAQFVQLDILKMPFAESFEAIGAFDVLEHIEDDETAIRQIHRALKPGGLVFLSVPQHPFLWSGEDTAAQHQRRYARKGLDEKLRSAGFKIVFQTSFVFALLPMLFLARLIPVREDPAASVEIPIGLELPRVVDRCLETVMRLDEWAIRRAISLPCGGSLMVVARKGSSPV